MKKQNKWLDNYGKVDNPNESTVSFSENFVGEGYDTEGRNYSPAWGGQFQTGGQIPKAQDGITFRDINDNPFVQAAKIFDPSGVSSYPDVYYSGEDFINNPSWSNAGNLGLNVFGALPMIGKLAIPAKLSKVASKTANKATGVSKSINSVIDTAPELIPFLRKPTEAVQDFTSKYLTAPLTNVKPGGRAYKVDQINSINNKVDRLNLVNNLSDVYSVAESIPKKSEQYATGGSIPGTVGFTYARTINPAPSEGKYAKKTLPSAQDGIRAFYENYINSPKYLERLNIQGYVDPQSVVADRLNNVKNVQVKNLPNTELFTPQNTGSYYFPDKNKINYDPFDLKLYPGSSKSDILAHEFSHSAGSMLPNTSSKNLTLNKSEVDQINKRNKSKDSHGKKANEAKADMDTLRYFLKKDSIYDTGNEEFTPELLKQTKEKYKNNYSIKRFFKNFSDDDILYMMNSIAMDNFSSNDNLPLAQNGQEMKFYQNRLDWKPKSMQDGGQQPLRVSTTDPRYAELYKNRQLGRWLDENTFDSQVPLDEVVVTGKDESLKEAIYQGNNRFLQNAFGVLGSSQTVPMELLTGKQQTPSEAWGFNTEGLSWYNPKSISNFAMDAVLDPMNAIGVGVADDLLRVSGRSIGKRIEFDPTQLPRLEPVNFNYDLSEFKRRNPPQLTNYEDDELITNTLRNFATDNQLPSPPSEIRIPDSAPRQLTAAEKRQGVKDFLNYRDISSLGIQNVRDAEEALNNWLTRNRFELPSDINIENRMSNLFNRYNIQSDDYNESIRNLPQDVKPQFLQELISTLPRKFSDDELIQMRMRYQDTQSRYQNSQRANTPSVKNRSGLTKDEVIQRSKDKDKVSKMTEEEFQNTVLKPSGEIADYVPGMDIDKLTYDPSSGRTILKDQVKMSEREYADAFNQRIDLLNEIIADRNKSGVEYKVKELSPSGYLTFETPSQNILDTSGNPITINPGESQWTVRLNPGQWKGDVEDIANSDYYRSIPGLEMSNTTGTVFADRTPRKGTGAYESINEYLKRMDLGRVKPGFNSQTAFSKGAWENFIKTGRGVGYYANPNLVYGTMKTLLPIGFGASYLSNQNSEFKKGGVIKDNRGQWNHPGEITEIDSPYITMEGVPYPVIGKSNTGDTKLMLPGENYKFKGKKVTEFPIAQWGKGVPFKDAATQPKNPANPVRADFAPPIRPRASFEEQKRIAKLELDKYGYTSDQRKGYVQGKSEKAFNNIVPAGYGDLEQTLDRVERYQKNLGRNPDETLWYSAEESSTGKPIYYDLPKRDDAFALYLGLPQKNKSFGISEYQPTNSKENKYYFKPNYLDENLKNALVSDYFNRKGSDEDSKVIMNERNSFRQKRDSLEKAGVPWENPINAEWYADNPLGDFKMSEGKDEKGNYLSIYDVWDLSPFKEGKGSSYNGAVPMVLKAFAKTKGYDVDDDLEMSKLFGAGKPFEIYDRIYYDPKTMKVIPQKRNGGKVNINDLDAQPKKKLNQLLNFTNNPDKNWLDKYQ